jgi:ribosomal 50S subunit-recycling heat shock protein
VKRTVKAWAVCIGKWISISDITKTRNCATNFAELYGRWWENEKKTKSPYRVRPITITYDDGRGRKR